jgi:TatD DNase family protein
VTEAFVDTHAHIQADEFSGDIEDVIARAFDAGVRQIVVPGVDVESSRAAIALSERWEGVYASAGFHPHEASRLNERTLAEIESLLSHPKVVAVGEAGLDYFYEHSPRDVQLACLSRMLELAERHTLPVIIHCRDAWEDMAEVLRPWAYSVREAFAGRPTGVMHYFSGSLEQARLYIDLGFMISIHTSVTHKKQAGWRDVVSQLPLQSLVLETDSPYGAPQSHRGRRNEPAYVVEGAAQVAAELGVRLEAVADATTANASRLFRLPAPVATEGSGR